MINMKMGESTLIRVWCERCCGTGNYDGNDRSCNHCQGKGYHEHSIEQIAEPVSVTCNDINWSCSRESEPCPYDITDAQADAAVLSAIHGFIPDGTSIGGEVASEIMNRLHAFYCGTGAE